MCIINGPILISQTNFDSKSIAQQKLYFNFALKYCKISKNFLQTWLKTKNSWIRDKEEKEIRRSAIFYRNKNS